MELLTIQQKVLTSLSAGESHFREFKSAHQGLPGHKTARPVKEICEDIAEAMVAFANADGGELMVGVEDNCAFRSQPENCPVYGFFRCARRFASNKRLVTPPPASAVGGGGFPPELGLPGSGSTPPVEA